MYRAGGSSVSLLQPLLDNQVGLKNMDLEKNPISLEKAISIIHDVFISAAEREIHTGDGILFNIITKVRVLLLLTLFILLILLSQDGIKTDQVALRRD